MALITRGTIPAGLDRNLIKMWGIEEKNRIAESLAEKFFEKAEVIGGVLRTTQLTGGGYHAIKNEGAGVAYGSLIQNGSKIWEGNVYGKAFRVTREMFEDEIGESIAKKLTLALQNGAFATREKVMIDVLNNFTSASYVGGDGVALCSTSHPTEAGNFSNLETAAALSVTALENAFINIKKYKTNDGLQEVVNPERLVVPPDLMVVARKIEKSLKVPGSMNNDANVVADMFKGVDVSPYLTSTTAWFVITDITNGLLKGDIRPMEFTRDNEFDTENLVMKVTQRFITGWADYRKVHGNAGL